MSLRICARRAAPSLWRTSRPIASVMPLKARLTESLPSASRPYSTTEDLLKAQENDEPDDVLFDTRYGVRTIELNRPSKLNSLNGSMARKIIPRLQEWSKSQMANVVVIKGSGRAFCAGGDVAALANWNTEGPEGVQKSSDYFALEYKLDHLIATYQKPYVAIMDGITMGGGVGLSVHAPFRIATENTVFAMPETTIGFFPDVGASFFLPRMEGEIGTYLALTSDQLRGVDVFYHGIATHYINSASLPDLEERLSELKFKDWMSLEERNKIINATIEEFVTGFPTDRAVVSGSLRNAVDSCFKLDEGRTIKSILASLKQFSESSDEKLAQWAAKTADTINQRSPIAVLVTMMQMRIGGKWRIGETFQREHNIATHFMKHHDFVEGVNARLVRRQKERPNWKPNTFEEVSEEDIRRFFSDTPQLQLLNTEGDINYSEYPHKWIGLPKEDAILRVLGEGNRTKEQIIDYFLQYTDGKHGVREKVGEILDRKAKVAGSDGKLAAK